MQTGRKECPIRTNLGNCIIGGFCTAVNKEICRNLRETYTKGFAEGFAEGREEGHKQVINTFAELDNAIQKANSKKL